MESTTPSISSSTPVHRVAQAAIREQVRETVIMLRDLLFDLEKGSIRLRVVIQHLEEIAPGTDAQTLPSIRNRVRE